MKITVNVSMKKSSVPTGVLVAALFVAITAADGSTHSKSVQAGDFATVGTSAIDPTDGVEHLVIPVTFDDSDGVPAGSFSGTAQVTAADNSVIGTPISFSAPDNQQFQPVSVNVTVG